MILQIQIEEDKADEIKLILESLSIPFEAVGEISILKPSKINKEVEMNTISEHLEKVQESLSEDVWERSDLFTRKTAFAKMKGFDRFSDLVLHYQSPGQANMMYQDYIANYGTEEIIKYFDLVE